MQQSGYFHCGRALGDVAAQLLPLRLTSLSVEQNTERVVATAPL